MAASKIKKGDRVVVLSGKDKGRTGDVLKAMPKEGKVIVSGVNGPTMPLAVAPIASRTPISRCRCTTE